MKKIKMASIAIIGIAVLWGEYRFDQTTHSTLAVPARFDVILGHWDSVYTTLQTIRYGAEKHYVWPKNFSELAELKQKWSKESAPVFTLGVQTHLQNLMFTYLVKRDQESADNFKSGFTLYSDLPYYETIALALYGWVETKESTAELDRQMNCFFGLYLTVLDVQFADRIINTSADIEDPFMKGLFVSFANLVKGNIKPAVEFSKTNSAAATTGWKALLISELAAGMTDHISQIEYLEKSLLSPEYKSNAVVAYRGHVILVNNMENYLESVKWLKQFSMTGESANWVNYWLSKSQQSAGLFKEAESTLSQITPSFFHFNKTSQTYAEVLNELKHFDKAIVILDDLNKRAPSSIGKMTLAHSLTEVGRPAEAEKFLLEVVDREPENFSALYSLGQVQFYRLNKFDEATASFQRALQLKPGDERLLRTLGDVAIAKGRVKK